MAAARYVRLTVTSVACGTALTLSTAAAAPDVVKASAKAEKALAKHKPLHAVSFAELAVSAAPTDAAARALLGRSYLAAGRYNSAATAFADALSLDQNDARSALNLALAQIAVGRTDAALATLDANRDRLAVSDLGLATALAGRPDEGVALLEAAVRAPAVDAKTRQNLALAYALAGKWIQARVLAVQDLPPADADARIMEWARFVRPQRQSDQVAALLGVQPVEDAGQPTALALAPPAASSEPETRLAVSEPKPAPSVPAPVEAPPTAVEQVVAAVTKAPSVVFAALNEVVQPVPQPVAATAWVPIKRVTPAKAAAMKPAAKVDGRFVVQLGAYGNEALARSAWKQVSVRHGLTGRQPTTAQATVKGGTYVRLAVTGFSDRNSAVQLCQSLQKSGRACFVRLAANDRPFDWAGRPSRLAAR